MNDAAWERRDHETAWNPAADEVDAILVTMRPLIHRCVDSDRRVLAAPGEPRSAA